MSHPARDPARSDGIDGKANALFAAQAHHHPARDPARSDGIDGKANALLEASSRPL